MEPVYDFEGSSVSDSPRPPEGTTDSPRPLLGKGKKSKKKTGDNFGTWRGTPSGLLAQPEGHIAGRRVFECTKDTLLSDAGQNNALAALQNAVEETAKFANELEKASQHLYQRASQSGKIAQEHLAQKTKLRTAYLKVADLWGKAKARYNEIAFIDNPQKIADAFSNLVTLEITTRALVKKYKIVGYILKSPHHHAALKFYKDKKRVCQQVRENKKLSVDQKVSKLWEIFNETKIKITEETPTLHNKKAVIAHQTALLYEELLHFITYTASSFEEQKQVLPESEASAIDGEEEAEDDDEVGQAARQMQDLNLEQGPGWASWAWSKVSWLMPGASSQPLEPLSDDALAQIEALKASITEQEAALLPYLPRKAKRVKLKGDELELVQTFIAACQTHKLEDKDDFRNGQSCTTTYAIGIYKELKTQIDNLRGISKALVELQNQILTSTKTLCGIHQVNKQYTPENFSTLLNHLEQAIYEQQDALEGLRFSKRVHAGWYYVAKLLAKVQEVRMDLHTFKSLSKNNPGFIPFQEATRRLIEYLKPSEQELRNNKDYLTGFMAIEKLFLAVQAATPLTKAAPQGKVRSCHEIQDTFYNVMTDILARCGLRTLTLSPEEKEVPMQLLLERPLSNLTGKDEDRGGLLPKRVIAFLIRSFLRCENFQKEEIDPELDLALFKLQNSTLYSQEFGTTKLLTQNFKSHLEKYEKHSDYKSANNHIMPLIIETLVALDPQVNTLERLFNYCKARQRLVEISSLSQGASAQQAYRTMWLYSKAAPELKAEENHLPYFYKDFEVIDETELTDPQLRERLASKARTKLELLGISGKELEQKTEEKVAQDLKKIGHRILYKHLVTSLFALDHSEKSQATTNALEMLDSLEVEELPQDNKEGLLLLERWVLDQFMNDAPKQTKHATILLTALFKKYLSDPATHLQWTNTLDIAYMEMALHKLFEKQEGNLPGIYGDMLNRRGPLLAQWNEVISIYKKFLTYFAEVNTFNNKTKPAAIKLQKEAQEAFGQQIVPERNTLSWSGIASWFYHDLSLKIQMNDTSMAIH